MRPKRTKRRCLYALDFSQPGYARMELVILEAERWGKQRERPDALSKSAWYLLIAPPGA
jgi:hypothetical protein